MLLRILIFCFILFLDVAHCANLMDDLLIVEYWNRKQNDRLPVLYNHLGYGGYFNMPSARMSEEGILGAGFAYAPPYHQYNLYCQLTSCLEITGNYRVFRGVDDPILSPLGFGDRSDKGINVKFAIFRPEDSDYTLPGIAVGWEDFIGTCNFKAKYLVLTQVFIKENLEISLGIGSGRIRRWFGGLAWTPFRQSSYCWLQPLSLAADYDATPYKNEKIEQHPKGRNQSCKINAGLKYRFLDSIDLSISYVRGEKFACSLAAFYDFGHTKGFIPKINDAIPYKAPAVREPLGLYRSENTLVHDLAFAFDEQGIELLRVALGYNDCGQKTLRLLIYNGTYRLEKELRLQLSCLLSALIPLDIEQVVVLVDGEGFPIQEYHFSMVHVRAFGDKDMGACELKVLTPLTDVNFVDPFSYSILFKKNREGFNWLILPKTHTFFGSSRGKFKYALGINVGAVGFLPSDIYYSVLLGYNFVSNLHHLRDTDRLNPSQIINVRSDLVRYYQQEGVTLDEAYLQKCWNMGRGFFSRVALGYFDEAYAGLASEVLYAPIDNRLSIGIEGALFKKRSYSGYGFTNKVRKLNGFTPQWKNFSLGSQYFLNFYYDWKEANLDLEIKVGKFLANDYGVRYQVSRYFPSGLEISIWYTHTNGHDKINGKSYSDKGVAFSLPLDIFYDESTRKRWRYQMPAWLRDVGIIGETGQTLYELISEQRQ